MQSFLLWFSGMQSCVSIVSFPLRFCLLFQFDSILWFLPSVSSFLMPCVSVLDFLYMCVVTISSSDLKKRGHFFERTRKPFLDFSPAHFISYLLGQNFSTFSCLNQSGQEGWNYHDRFSQSEFTPVASFSYDGYMNKVSKELGWQNEC